MDQYFDLDTFKAYCLTKPGSEETYPFHPEHPVFKVRGKMFALCFEIKAPLKLNLKCHPDLAPQLREQFEAIEPGWHMNKFHWNTITLGKDLPPEMQTQLIDMSYELVVKGLKKKDQKALGFA